MVHLISFLGINYYILDSIQVGKKKDTGLPVDEQRGLLKGTPIQKTPSLYTPYQLHNLIMTVKSYFRRSLVRFNLDFTETKVYFYIP